MNKLIALQLHAQKWLKHVQIPVVEKPATTKGCFQFQAPTRVYVGGAATFNINVDPQKTVDIFLEIPKVVHFIMYTVRSL